VHKAPISASRNERGNAFTFVFHYYKTFMFVISTRKKIHRLWTTKPRFIPQPRQSPISEPYPPHFTSQSPNSPNLENEAIHNHHTISNLFHFHPFPRFETNFERPSMYPRSISINTGTSWCLNARSLYMLQCIYPRERTQSEDAHL